MNNYIEIYSLIGCPYSKKAENMLKKNNIQNKIIHVNYNTKRKYKIWL